MCLQAVQIPVVLSLVDVLKIKNPSRVDPGRVKIHSSYAYELTIRFHTFSFGYTIAPPPTVV